MVGILSGEDVLVFMALELEREDRPLDALPGVDLSPLVTTFTHPDDQLRVLRAIRNAADVHGWIRAESFDSDVYELTGSGSQRLTRIHLPGRLLDRAQGVIQQRIHERETEAARAVATAREETKADAAKSVQLVRELLRSELRTRVRIGWDVYREILRKRELELCEATAGRIRDAIASTVDATSFDLRGAAAYLAKGEIDRSGKRVLKVALRRAMDSVEADIGYWMLAPSRENPRMGDINITGSTIGAVQTGAHAQANVSQVIDATRLADLTAALSQVTEQVRSDTSIEPETRETIVALVDDTLTEAEKREPSRLRLAAKLSGVATAIQTTAALPDAWKLVKAAAAAMGFHVA